MKKLTEFTEENAKSIARLLELNYSGYSRSENEVMVEDKLDFWDTGKEKVVYIYSTGKVSFFVNDGGPEGRVPKEIDPLPIINYLKEKGFSFQESAH